MGGLVSVVRSMPPSRDLRHSRLVQSQELSLPSRHVVEPAHVEPVTVVLTSPRPDHGVGFALISVASALVWVMLLVLAVPTGVLCAVLDGALRMRRLRSAGP